MIALALSDGACGVHVRTRSKISSIVVVVRSASSGRRIMLMFLCFGDPDRGGTRKRTNRGVNDDRSIQFKHNACSTEHFDHRAHLLRCNLDQVLHILVANSANRSISRALCFALDLGFEP